MNAEHGTNDIRRAVAAAVRRGDGLVLAVRRPDEPGEELLGVWGLPATTLHDGETPEQGIQRIGREKLGVELTARQALAEGEQRRTGYTLRMMVYEASMAGEARAAGREAGVTGTLYDAIDWRPADAFQAAADQGSLCCELFLGALTRGGKGEGA